MISVVGGVYHEVCFEPHWDEIYGSGFRGCLTMLAFDINASIKFHTLCPNNTQNYLQSTSKSYPNFQLEAHESSVVPRFYYVHPLSHTSITPRIDVIKAFDYRFEVNEDNVLLYGMIDAIVQVNAKKTVYDPQSPVNTLSFSSTNSKTNELVYVLNEREAHNLCNSRDINVYRNYFIVEEGAIAVIIKKGPDGAILIQKDSDEIKHIPCYQTDYVWPIGSGDVFSSAFAYHWFLGIPILESANIASWCTAEYCRSASFAFSQIGSNEDIKPLKQFDLSKKQIYIAGPFFCFQERWLVDQVYQAFASMKINIFSPWHSVGIGPADIVVEKDIKAINESDVIFAIVDGLDSGTLFEIGYAVSKGIPVIAYVQKEHKESLTMIEGTHCIIETDLSTAIYKTIWSLNHNE